jgi:DNA-binding response OmpR family regulator
MVTRVQGKTLVIGNYRNRYNVIKALRGADFSIIEATEGIRGLKHVIEEAPNVVIINQGKVISETIRLLRAVRCLTSAPILVVGPGNGDAVTQSRLNGADAYLPRMFDVGTLLANLRILLSRN